MTLLESQFEFSTNVANLIVWAVVNGYKITFGEAYRPPEMAKIYAAQGKGIACSLHTQRLAVDLNLFKNGLLLSNKEDYEPLGVLWKGLYSGNCWGGDFERPDSDHFSFSWDGKK